MVNKKRRYILLLLSLVVGVLASAAVYDYVKTPDEIVLEQVASVPYEYSVPYEFNGKPREAYEALYGTPVDLSSIDYLMPADPFSQFLTITSDEDEVAQTDNFKSLAWLPELSTDNQYTIPAADYVDYAVRNQLYGSGLGYGFTVGGGGLGGSGARSPDNNTNAPPIGNDPVEENGPQPSQPNDDGDKDTDNPPGSNPPVNNPPLTAPIDPIGPIVDVPGNDHPVSVPEPSSIALFGIGLVGLLTARKRKNNK
jgi:hypothetical protein